MLKLTPSAAALADEIAARVIEQIAAAVAGATVPDANRLLTIEEAAAFFHRHPNWMREQARTGRIKAFKNGQEYFFRQAWLDEYVEREASGSEVVPAS